MATALYRRYRPETFADVIGQDHVTVPLMRALRSGRIGHAYLFSGPRGCGKTTSARILARCLNCAEGPTDTPCGRCDSCTDLARGGPGSLDVVEIDAASHGGVDDARELRERATFAPARDRFKVFIIDEAHMVTSAGFNALLKLVEEPPEHVKFVFATTEPEKVIGTIRSRTHHYPFRLIPPQVLTPYLEEICGAEGVHVGEGVLPLVVRAGGGSARDTLSVLDQLMAGAGEDGLDHATAISLLGFTDTELLDRAVDAISRRDASGIYGAVEQVIASGQEPRRFVEDLLERLRDLIVLSAVQDRGEGLLPQLPADELARMRDQVQGIEPADLSRCGDLVHETLSTMSGATSPRLHLELLAARLVLRDERAQASQATGGSSAPAAPESGRAPSARAPMGTSGGNVSGRDRARQIAQQQAESARRGREGGAPDQSAAPAPAPVSARAQAPAPAPAPQDPAAGAPAPIDDDWGPVAGVGQGAPTRGASSRPDQEGGDRIDRAAPLHGGVVPAEQERGTAAEQAPRAGGEETGAGNGARPRPDAGGLDADEVRGHWSAILDELQQIRRPTWALVSQNAHVHGAQGSTLTLGFRTEGLLAAFRRGTGAQNVADAVRRVMHREVDMDAVVGEDPGGDPGFGGPGGPGRSGGPGGSGSPGGPDRSGSRGASRGDEGRARPDRPAPSEREGAEGQRPDDHRAAARTSGERTGLHGARGGGGFGEDLPPEPDDPYPPDPQDEIERIAGGPEDRPVPGRDAAPGGAGPGDAPGERPRSASPSDTSPRGPRESGTQESGPRQSGSRGRNLTPIVIPDDSRDGLTGDTPRTHGQEALRRALAEGRPVRTEPRETPSTAEDTPAATVDEGAPASTVGRGVEHRAPGGDATDGVADHGRGQVAAGDDAAPERAAQQAPAPARAEDDGWGDVSPVRPGGASATPPAPDPRGDASTPTDPGPGAPSASTSPESASPAPAAAPQAAPARAAGASGAALVREAALASRQSAPPQRGAARARQGADDAAPADPTGGASRFDEDAQHTARRPQEIVEKLLGGTVLEIIDESR